MNLTAPDMLKTLDRTPATLGLLPQAAASGGGRSPAPAFSQILEGKTQVALQGGQTPTQAQAARQAQAEKAAGDLVSNALILPMLKQLRRSPWSQNTVFSAGLGEKAFGPEFDIQISDRIAHSPRLGIKAALTKRLMQRGSANAGQKTNAATGNITTDGRLNLHG